MTLEFDKIVEEFLKENDLELTKEELLEMTKLFFEFIRKEIESGNLNQIRIKYFGAFRPLLGKLKHLKENINWSKLTPKEQERYIQLFKNYDSIIEEIEKES